MGLKLTDLALLPPRNFAVFQSQYLLEYCTQRAEDFANYPATQALFKNVVILCLV